MNKRIDASHLDAAMTTTEPQVDVPNRRQTGSMRSQVEALGVDQIASKIQPVDEGMVLSSYIQKAPELREQLRNSLTSAVANARERTGGTYTIEVGEMVMRNRLYLVAVITRTA